MLLAQQCQKWDDSFLCHFVRQVVETDQGIKVVVDSKAVWCPTVPYSQPTVLASCHTERSCTGHDLMASWHPQFRKGL